MLATSILPASRFGSCSGFAGCTPPSLAPVFPFLAHASSMRPHSSVYMRYRNLNLSIGYVFDLALAPTLPRADQLYLETFDIRPRGFPPLSLLIPAFSSYPSTAPSGTASSVLRMLLYQLHLQFRSFGVVFQPRHFRRRTSRLVSCYALFECVWLLLSQHPSCLEILHPFPLNTHFGTLAGGLLFPFDCPTYLVQSDSVHHLHGIGV